MSENKPSSFSTKTSVTMPPLPPCQQDAAGDAAVHGGDHSSDATSTATEEPAPPKPQRTFVVRTPDSSSSLKVTVPSTTAEAMAMNQSIRENARAKKEAAARRQAATTAARASKQPGDAGGGGVTAAAAPHSRGRPAERRRAPSLMVVTPNARSKSIQMEVPLTTAECIELNRAVKERYPTQQEEEADEDSSNSVNAGYSRRWRNPPAPGVGGGQGAQHAYGAGLSPSPEIVRYADVEQGAREPSYDRTIGNLHRARRWDQIVRVWEVRDEIA